MFRIEVKPFWSWVSGNQTNKYRISFSVFSIIIIIISFYKHTSRPTCVTGMLLNKSIQKSDFQTLLLYAFWGKPWQCMYCMYYVAGHIVVTGKWMNEAQWSTPGPGTSSVQQQPACYLMRCASLFHCHTTDMWSWKTCSRDEFGWCWHKSATICNNKTQN